MGGLEMRSMEYQNPSLVDLPKHDQNASRQQAQQFTARIPAVCDTRSNRNVFLLPKNTIQIAYYVARSLRIVNPVQHV